MDTQVVVGYMYGHTWLWGYMYGHTCGSGGTCMNTRGEWGHMYGHTHPSKQDTCFTTSFTSANTPRVAEIPREEDTQETNQQQPGCAWKIWT